MMETLATDEYGGEADLPEIGNQLTLEMDELLPLAETLDLMGLAQLAEGDIKLTASGKAFADMSTEDRKKLFATHLTHHVPLAAHIKRVLDERRDHRAPRIRFETELEDYLPEEEATETLEAVINWARYAELFSYNDANEVFSLEDPHAED